MQFYYGIRMNTNINLIEKIIDNRDVNMTKNKINIVNFLYYANNLNFHVQGLFAAIYALVFGSKIMNLMSKQNSFKIDPLWEYKMAKWIVMVQIIYSSFAMLFNIVSFIFDKEFILLALIPSVYLSTSAQILIMSIISYNCFLILR